MKKSFAILGLVGLLILASAQPLKIKADVGNSFSGGGGGGVHSHRPSRTHPNRASDKSENPAIAFVFFGGMIGVGLVKYLITRSREKERPLGVLDEIRTLDPTFEEAEFLYFVQQVFLRVQEAWASCDMRPVRTLESPELFGLHQRQLESYPRRGGPLIWRSNPFPLFD